MVLLIENREDESYRIEVMVSLFLKMKGLGIQVSD